MLFRSARFVSGYLMQPSPPAQTAKAPSVSHADQIELHAWCEAYVPDIGWIGLDPTSGLLAGAAHVPVACAPLPAAAAPVEGNVDTCEVDFSYRLAISSLPSP